MKGESGTKNELRVQPSGRPSGAPYRLDAEGRMWEANKHSKYGNKQDSIQTRNHNLKTQVFGPTIGDHLKPQN